MTVSPHDGLSRLFSAKSLWANNICANRLNDDAMEKTSTMKYGFCRCVCINLDLIGRRFAKQIHRDEAKRNRDEFFGVD